MAIIRRHIAPWEGARYAMTDDFKWTRTTDEQLRVLWNREPRITVREIGQHFSPPCSEGQISYRARQLELPNRAHVTKPQQTSWPKSERTLEQFKTGWIERRTVNNAGGRSAKTDSSISIIREQRTAALIKSTGQTKSPLSTLTRSNIS